MKAAISSLLHPLAYALWAALVVGSIVFSFKQARSWEPVHDHTMLPLVTRERALDTGGFWEIRERGSLCMMAKGLSSTEMLLEEHRLWRQGLAPATIVTVAPRQEAARLKYSFENRHHGQVMTIRVGGRDVARRGTVGRRAGGRHGRDSSFDRGSECGDCVQRLGPCASSGLTKDHRHFQ
jgi:hypothetical protein